MTTIKLPKERAYYLASQNEIHCLLCWVPVQEYDHLIQSGCIPQYIQDDYPDGLEIEVSTPGFNEFQIDLGVSPEAIKHAYVELAARRLLPPSGAVSGAQLESIAKNIDEHTLTELSHRSMDVSIESIREKLPEPAMTEGEDAMVAMRELE